jgi:hypothetical protein
LRLTIIHDSDRNAIVHAAGCGAIRRDIKRRSHISHWDADHASVQAAANDAWSDFIGESMTEEDALGYTTAEPCTDGLPETTPETITITRELLLAVLADRGLITLGSGTGADIFDALAAAQTETTGATS